MHQDTVSRRQRELIVVVAFTTVLGFGVFVFFMLVLQWYFLAFLAGIAVMALAAGMHYTIWGRRLERAEREEANPRLMVRAEQLGPSTNGIAHGTPKLHK
jgi:membrane protein implicated in regulation of membrane protease activity